ncbi:MAG TPA: hypothetical protein PLP17_08195, partial [Oligoflexia bacterium]|nr:hypothetical protein [Oligoflexia bacterium]
NGDWAKIASLPPGETIVDESGKPRGRRSDRFGYEGDRPAQWKDARDAWVHGFWMYDWADAYLKIAAIDRENRWIATEPPEPRFGYKAGQRFRFINILEELDQPGEYYVDRESGMLYLWPPSPVKTAAQRLISMFMRKLSRMRLAMCWAWRTMTRSMQTDRL